MLGGNLDPNLDPLRNRDFRPSRRKVYLGAYGTKGARVAMGYMIYLNNRGFTIEEPIHPRDGRPFRRMKKIGCTLYPIVDFRPYLNAWVPVEIKVALPEEGPRVQRKAPDYSFRRAFNDGWDYMERLGAA